MVLSVVWSEVDGWTGMESCLHDTLEDDDFVVIGAGRHGAQRLDIRGHVLQVMGSPHRSGQVGPTLQDINKRVGTQMSHVIWRNRLV